MFKLGRYIGIPQNESLLPMLFTQEPVLSLHREMDNLFNEFFGHDWGMSFTSVRYPRINVSETDTELKVVAEVPGYTEKTLKVEFDEGVITISGNSSSKTSNTDEVSDKKQEGTHDIYREIQQKSFQRTIPLPCNVSQKIEDIMASFKDGILTISLKKVEPPTSTSKKIDIHKG